MRPHDRAGRSEHFAHPRAAFGAFVADDDDVAILDFAVQDALEGVFFGFVDDGFTGEGAAFLAGNLGDRSFRREVAAENTEVAVGLDGIREGTDHVLVRRVVTDVREVFGDGLTGDRQAIAMQEPLIEQHLEQRLEAANADEVSHVIFAAGLEVGEHGDLTADALEVLEGQFDAGGVGHRDEVKHRVRRAAEGDNDGDGVFKGL